MRPLARAEAPASRRRERGHHPLVAAVTWALAALALGCSQSALVGREESLAPFDGGVPDGPGYVDGRVHYHAVFDYVDSVYWIGATNDPNRVELYIYQDKATCAELSTPGWATRVRPTDLMGITLGGTTPGTYLVAPETPPRPGNAYVLHEIDQADPVIDSIGQSGTILITSVKPAEVVSGTLRVAFPIGGLEGAFNATWCATGVSLY
jgi:hypothetical protein